MQLKNVFAPGGLMQPVDILRDDRAQLPLALKLGKAEMYAVRLHAVDNELIPVEAVILLGVPVKEAAAQNSLGRVLPLLVIQAVDAPEVGYAALGADACAAEENDIIALRDHIAQQFYFIFHVSTAPLTHYSKL